MEPYNPESYDVNPIPNNPEEHEPWPQKLFAQVVMNGNHPKIRGYDFFQDIAIHYDFTELLYLIITGSFPTNYQKTLFEIGLMFSSIASINEAPVHAATLSHICGADLSRTLSVGVVGLTEQSKFVLNKYDSFLELLSKNIVDVPSDFKASDEQSQFYIKHLRTILSLKQIVIPILDHELDSIAALLIVFFHSGLQNMDHIKVVTTLSKIPVLIAETLALKVGDFKKYPLNLPAVHYQMG